MVVVAVFVDNRDVIQFDSFGKMPMKFNLLIVVDIFLLSKYLTKVHKFQN